MIDISIGISLMYAMIHFIIALLRGRMKLIIPNAKAKKHLVMGLISLTLSLGLFIYQYGAAQILENGIYFGALLIVLIFHVSARYWVKD